MTRRLSVEIAGDAPSAAAVRASIERGDGDLEQIGATVRAVLAGVAARAIEVESDLLTETEG